MEKEKKSKIRLDIMAIILILILSFALTPVVLQNDTFYTIKIGEFIMNNSIKIQQDPFSWHDNIEYTFPHWAYDILTYLIYNYWGLTGIYIFTIIFAMLLGLCIYYVNVKLSNNRIISFIVTVATLYLLKNYICARAQLITFILFILTVFFIEKFLETRQIKYAVGLIIIPILIANVHLATFPFYFVLYLPYFAEYGIYVLGHCNVIICGAVIDKINKKIKKYGATQELTEKLEKEERRFKRLEKNADDKFNNPYKIKIEYKPNIKWLAVIFIICLFTGFLTPLGTTPYTYLIKTMQGISTKNISEHLPVVLAENKELLIIFAVYIATLCFTKIKIKFSNLCMIAGLTILAIYTRRQESMLYLIGSIMLNRIFFELLNSYRDGTVKKLEWASSTVLGIFIISCLCILLSIYKYKPKIGKKYIDENSYPVQAATWIKENLNVSEIKLYNEYNYGSYLVYQGIPVFIDSRCDLYLPEFNKDVNVFEDFLNMNNLNKKFENIEKIMDKYEFTHIIIKDSTKLNKYLEIMPEKYNKIYPTDDIKDNTFIIYERINEE